MAASRDASEAEPRRNRSRTGTLTNAFVGAVVSVVFSFVPFSPILGGAVAAYLQKGDSDESIRVGAISGLMAAAPLVLIVSTVFGFLSLVTLVEAEPVATGFFGLLLLVAAGAILVYTVGLSAVGGFVGHVVLDRQDRRGRHRRDVAGGRSDPCWEADRSRSATDDSTADRDETAEPGDRDEDGPDRRSDE
ncbi:MAG: DUF5518 domain-containing protein [archaeon]